MMQYEREDERIDAFKRFLSFDPKERYHIEVLYFYLKILRCKASMRLTFQGTEENIATLLGDDSEKIFLDAKTMINKSLELFQNASMNLKKEIRREMVCNSCVLVNDMMLTDVTTIDKLEIYGIVQFYTTIITKHNNTIHAILLERADKDGMLHVDQFRELFLSSLSEEDAETIFGSHDFSAFMKKFFKKHIQVI